MESMFAAREQIRRSALHTRDRITDEVRRRKSLCITSRVLAMEEVRRAAVLFVYMHFRSEVETLELIERLLAAGHIVTVPVTLREKTSLLAVRITDPHSQVTPGYCGIPEPVASHVVQHTVDPAGIEAAVVPGVVFDRSGGRLGYGGGYYDRFLHRAAPAAVRIGLAFEDQLVEKVPVQPHDQTMDYVVSELQVYCCRR
jgi:5-formyltetrahydrofolate cyclo-ligase